MVIKSGNYREIRRNPGLIIKAMAIGCLFISWEKGVMATMLTRSDSGSGILIPEPEKIELPGEFDRLLLRVVPGENFADVRQGILRSVVRSGETPLSIEPLHGGMSAKVFSLSTDQRIYVLRIIPRRKDHTEFRREIVFSDLMSKLNIGPHLYYAGEEDGIIIMEKLPGTGKASGRPSHKYLKKLAKLLQKLHATPYTGEDFRISMHQRTLGIVERLGTGLPDLSREILKAAAESYEALSLHNQPILVHHDLNPNNILDDGKRLWLIDWELTGTGDLWYDLANAAVFLCHTPEDEALFLRAYLNRLPDPVEEARFFLNKILCFTFYGHVLQIVADDGAFLTFDKRFDSLPRLLSLLKKGRRWANFAAGPASVSEFGMILLKEAYILSHSQEFRANLAILAN